MVLFIFFILFALAGLVMFFMGHRQIGGPGGWNFPFRIVGVGVMIPSFLLFFLPEPLDVRDPERFQAHPTH